MSSIFILLITLCRTIFITLLCFDIIIILPSILHYLLHVLESNTLKNYPSCFTISYFFVKMLSAR